jgi:hypothetical protein
MDFSKKGLIRGWTLAQKSDIWSQASYRYAILWVAFLDPSDSYFLFADFVDFYTHWTYMLIFLSNYCLRPNIRFLPSIVAEKNATKNEHICSMCIKINKVGKLPVCRLCWFLYTLSIYAHFSSHFSQQLFICSMCIKINKVGKQEVGIWRVQKRYPQYGIPIWCLRPNIRFLPSTVTEKNFRLIFLSNYWWQESDIWSQASYRYAILWEAFLDPSDWVPIWSLWPNIRFLPSIVAEKNATKNEHICSMCKKISIIGEH